ncbi:MAG: ABC transporter ATP-binding protein/permease [Lachnospiraceae bacterium]|nr:ABC transporter ATP-binding protein/permease [Lachnospiraceae bacterium]
MALRWLVKHSKTQIPALAAVTIINGIYALFSLAFAWLCRGIIDSADLHDRHSFIKYSILMMCAIVLAFAMQIGSNSISERIHARLGIIYRNHLLHILVKKEYQQVSAFHSGEILNRMFNDTQVICDGVTTILPGFVLMVTKGICAVAVLFALSPMFTLIFFIGGILLIGVTAIFRSKMKALHKQVQEQAGKVRSLLQEIIESLLIIKVFRAERKMLWRASVFQEDYFKAQMKRRRISIWAGAGVGFAFEAAYLFALMLGAEGIMAGTMTYGTLTAILQLVGQVKQPFANLSGLLPRYYSMTASVERLIELEALPDEEERETVVPSVVYDDMDAICAEHISFSYGRSKVLDDMSFSIEKRDFVSITGLSGGGKSTAFLLMLGVCHPQEGSLYIRKKNGEKLCFGKDTRCLFAYVPQCNYLFSGTLRDNITFLRDNVTEDEINRVLRLSCADTFVDSLPDGLDTVIGERGYGLSEGQGQRIAIARALLSGAPVLLLDEATSALDEATELAVLENISSLKEKTCFIVTHRRAAISFCNRHMTIGGET